MLEIQATSHHMLRGHVFQATLHHILRGHVFQATSHHILRGHVLQAVAHDGGGGTSVALLDLVRGTW